MDIFSIFKIAGGIGLFLFGMKTMGNAIGRQAGGKFKTILENLTASPVKGVLLGAGITAIIQSSAATSVMVLGFVNSGIMSLESSIGLIMGANIGTTATGWILSLNSISGTSFILRLLNPSSFVPLLAFIGASILLFSKNEKKQDIAKIIIGFAILMYGMSAMSDALKPLTGSEEFKKTLTMFSNPILGVLIGFIITAITQSSSASVGILQALSVTGGITFITALPIVMGINIGAVLVVLLAAVGSNKDAKRIAVIDLLFNIIGTIICLSLYWILNSIFDFTISNATMGYVSIATVHTSFKIIITIMLLPFRKALIYLSKLIVRPGKEDDRFQLLDEHFFATPALAVSRCRMLTVNMANMAKDSLFKAMDSVYKFDNRIFSEVMTIEDEIDTYEDKLGSYMLKLSANRMTIEDSHEISRLLHCIGDFERISDHSVNIIQAAEELHEKRLYFSDAAVHDLNIMYDAVREIVNMTVDAFEKNSVEAATMIEPLEEVIDGLKVSLKTRHILRLQHGECTVVGGFIFSDIITSCERIADHCSNIAICIIELSEENFELHQQLKIIKDNSNSLFVERYHQYLKKYEL